MIQYIGAEKVATVTGRLARIEEQLSGAVNTAQNVLDTIRAPQPETAGEGIPPAGCVTDRASAIEQQVSTLNKMLEEIAGAL